MEIEIRVERGAPSFRFNVTGDSDPTSGSPSSGWVKTGDEWPAALGKGLQGTLTASFAAYIVLLALWREAFGADVFAREVDCCVDEKDRRGKLLPGSWRNLHRTLNESGHSISERRGPDREGEARLLVRVEFGGAQLELLAWLTRALGEREILTMLDSKLAPQPRPGVESEDDTRQERGASDSVDCAPPGGTPSQDTPRARGRSRAGSASDDDRKVASREGSDLGDRRRSHPVRSWNRFRMLSYLLGSAMLVGGLAKFCLQTSAPTHSSPTVQTAGYGMPPLEVWSSPSRADSNLEVENEHVRSPVDDVLVLVPPDTPESKEHEIARRVEGWLEELQLAYRQAGRLCDRELDSEFGVRLVVDATGGEHELPAIVTIRVRDVGLEEPLQIEYVDFDLTRAVFPFRAGATLEVPSMEQRAQSPPWMGGRWCAFHAGPASIRIPLFLLPALAGFDVVPTIDLGTRPQFSSAGQMTVSYGGVGESEHQDLTAANSDELGVLDRAGWVMFDPNRIRVAQPTDNAASRDAVLHALDFALVARAYVTEEGIAHSGRPDCRRDPVHLLNSSLTGVVPGEAPPSVRALYALLTAELLTTLMQPQAVGMLQHEPSPWPRLAEVFDQEGRTILVAATREYARAAELAPAQLDLVWLIAARQAQLVGDDPRPFLRRAVESPQTSDRERTAATILLLRADALYARGECVTELDDDEALRAAVSEHQGTLGALSLSGHDDLADFELGRLRFALARGGSSPDDLQRAIQHLGRVRGGSPLARFLLAKALRWVDPMARNEEGHRAASLLMALLENHQCESAGRGLLEGECRSVDPAYVAADLARLGAEACQPDWVRRASAATCSEDSPGLHRAAMGGPEALTSYPSGGIQIFALDRTGERFCRPESSAIVLGEFTARGVRANAFGLSGAADATEGGRCRDTTNAR